MEQSGGEDGTMRRGVQRRSRNSSGCSSRTEERREKRWGEEPERETPARALTSPPSVQPIPVVHCWSAMCSPRWMCADAQQSSAGEEAYLRRRLHWMAVQRWQC